MKWVLGGGLHTCKWILAATPDSSKSRYIHRSDGGALPEAETPKIGNFIIPTKLHNWKSSNINETKNPQNTDPDSCKCWAVLKKFNGILALIPSVMMIVRGG